MPPITSRNSFNPQSPYRKKRPKSMKIIVLALEGSVTEQKYFELISDLFSEVRTKIHFVSDAEDAVHTVPKYRTAIQRRQLSMSRPKQLVQRLDQFKIEKEGEYEFSKNPGDEFWIVTDVDQNWSNVVIDTKTGKTYLDEWNDAIKMCREKGYGYAVSNPVFEIWLLLHHDDPTAEDMSFAVTDDHPYEKTGYFRERLRALGAPLKDEKKIRPSDYNTQNVRDAIRRARELHHDKDDLCPKCFATTVYLLVQKIVELLPDYTQSVNTEQ